MTFRIELMLGFTLLASACQIEQLPEDETSETSGYWDQAEVDAACESWAEAQTMCSSGGPAADELADSCRESVMVDNPNEDAGCHEALVERYACVGGLTCEELIESVDQVGDYPCKAEDEALTGAC